MVYAADGQNLIVSEVEDFDLEQTLFCGQCFRFAPCEEGFRGVGQNRPLTLAQPKPDTLIFYNTTENEFLDIWVPYFDLSRDYIGLRERMRNFQSLVPVADFTPGLRVMNQEGWETLCTFIISQNNHIPRITGIVQRLCELLGEQLDEGLFSFPTAESLAACSLEELTPLRAGFRAKYLLDAARCVCDGTVRLDTLPAMPTPEAVKHLCQIKGVGIKVASCALLYGFGHADAFPIDVWIGRAMEQILPDGLPKELEEHAGLVQQYLFNYIRGVKGD